MQSCTKFTFEYCNTLKSMAFNYLSAAPPGQQCATGFLKEQSLRMIVEAPRNITYSSSSFSFPGIDLPQMTMSMPITQCGPLRKMVIAARSNVSAPVGWPELQIIRNASNGTRYVAFTTSTTEPTPTGYLNVYEYDLAATEFIIQVGDILNISWHGDMREPDQIRFSLAYFNNGTSSSIPMVSIVVGDCGPDTDLLILSTPYCEEYNTDPQPSTCDTISTKASTVRKNSIRSSTTTVVATEPPTNGSTSTKMATKKSDSAAKLTTSNVATIIGVVLFSLLLTILLILVVICMIVIRRRRKSTSVNNVDSTGMRYVNEAHPFHDTAGKIILTFLFVEFLVHPYNLQGM